MLSVSCKNKENISPHTVNHSLKIMQIDIKCYGWFFFHGRFEGSNHSIQNPHFLQCFLPQYSFETHQKEHFIV